jgi:hypothetical protein
VRVAIVSAALMQIPGVRGALWRVEHALCDSPLRCFGGFWIAALHKS